ncbi:PAS domain S-box protein [Flavihumibacter sp. UBA7668]|uniref:PAS domain S-box protein n=1 Tax=Flavihumibacter sp. UBA7668 TaxID=1946542 RepID=UPI0025BEE0BF|nr:PAS domain S-box protein [Flavihumibacter sp. UBA7668]
MLNNNSVPYKGEFYNFMLPGLFESVFAAITNPCLLLEPDVPNFQIITANQAYLDITGTKLEDIQNRSFFEAFPLNPAEMEADGVPNLRQSLTDVITTGSVQYMHQQKYDLPIRSSTTAFELRYWDVVNSPVRNEQGELIALLHTVTDVTEKVLFDRKLRLNENRLHSLVQEGSDLIAILDLNANYNYVSPTSLAVLGLDPRELVGKNAFDYIHEGDRVSVMEQFRRIESESRILLEPFRFQHANGAWHWIETIAVNLLQDPSINGIVVNSRDITHRIKAERQKQVLADISLVFNESGPFVETLKEMVDLLSSKGPYAIVECWLTDPQSRQLNLLAKFGAKEEEGNADWKELVMQAIKTGEPVKRSGVYAIPLYHHQGINAVLVTVSSEGEEEQDFILRSAGIRSFIGGEIYRKQLEHELNQVFSLSEDIICIASFQGYFKKLNPAAMRMLGYSEAELLSRPWISFIHPDDKRIIEERFSLPPVSGERYFFEVRFLSAEGKIIWINLTLTASVEEQLFYGTGKDSTDKKKLEDLLAKSLQLAQIGSWELDLQQPGEGSLYLSEITRSILEIPPDQPVSLAEGIDFYTGDSRERLEAALQDLMNGGREYDLELLMRTAGGKGKWVRAIGRSEWRNNTCVRIFGSFQDIHAAKLAQIAVRNSEEKLRLVMNGALDAIVSIDTEERITFWNSSAETIFGWTAAEVMGLPLSEFIVPAAYRGRHSQGMKRYLATGESQILNQLLELPAVRRNGEEFPIELTVIPIRQEGEISFCAFIRDITDRKKADQNLRDSKERFEKVAQATNDAIWDWDLVAGSIYRGAGFDRLLGYEVESVRTIRESWWDHVHADDQAEVQRSMEEAMADREVSHWEMEYRLVRADSEVISVLNRGMIIRNQQGEVVRMVGALSDITYRKEFELSLRNLNQELIRTNEELAGSNQELEQFAFIASHDLQEPLRMVTGFLSQLQRKYGPQLDEKARQYIHYAVDGAARMRLILLDLLEYSRAGRTELKLERVDLNLLLGDVRQLLQVPLRESGAVLELGDLPVLQTSLIPLQQVFVNLISNAIKYSREGVPPVIRVSAALVDGHWQFSVCDNGIGIEEEYYQKIFLIFQRLQVKSDAGGSGVGLSITRKIIERLGGRIWLESIPGSGSCFFFTL